MEWGEGESDGEAEDCGENGQDAPGELQEGEFGAVVPDECGEWCEEEGDGYGEDGKDVSSWPILIGVLALTKRGAFDCPLLAMLASDEK